MKPKILLTCLLATGLFFGTSALRAEGAKPPGSKPDQGAAGQPPENRRKEMAELKKKFDANADGKLDEAERKAMQEAMANDPQFQKMREARLKRFDTNGDGKLDDTEKAAADAAMKDRMGGPKGKMMEKFDTNGDGQLDETEKAAAKAEMEKHKGEKKGPPADANAPKPPAS